MGSVDNPHFYSGLLPRPEVVAAGLLAVADVAAAKYTDHSVAKMLASLDPVVTGSGDRLRFESFSGCNGVYARLDLLADGLDNEVAFGTTNIDINLPLREALIGIGRDDLVHLGVGRDELRLSTPAATHVERKVKLPERWVRGFAEVPQLMSGATQVFSLVGAASVVRFLSALPKSKGAGPDVHLQQHGRSLRWTPVLWGTPRTEKYVAGLARLVPALRIARYTNALHFFATQSGSSAWVFELPGARLSLVLSRDVYQGFSGEGSLLTRLAHPEVQRLGMLLSDELHWQPRIDATLLAGRSKLDSDEVQVGLSWLAASGKVGYDLSESAWYHRNCRSMSKPC